MAEIISRLSILWTDHRYGVALLAYLLWLAIGWTLVKGLDLVASNLVKKTKTKIDDIILKEAQILLWLIVMVTGFFVIAHAVDFPDKIIHYVDRFTQLSIIFLIIYFFIRIGVNITSVSARHNSALKNMLPTFSRIANVVIWGIGILMVMDIFGISITPVLASVGLASFVIGLALQDTLGNFFSGLYILVNQPIRVGDYIELDNGLKGYVVKIGWRETRIRTLPNNYIVVPNTKLSQSILTNYHLPQQEMACLVQVGVSYDSDLEKVEKVTVEVGKQVLQKVKGAVPEFDPFIRFHTFNDFSIDFTVILRVKEFVDKYLLTHEFVKALHKRYNQEGIVIPFPIRTVEMKKENS